MLKLNLGCGLQCPEGWENIDSSFGVKISKRPLLKKILHFVVPSRWGVLPNVKWPANTKWMDLTKKFKYEDGSVSYIYSSHTFEHFSFAESTFVLSECYRVMKKGGIIRIIVPDFEAVLEVYLKLKKEDPAKAALAFTNQSGYFEIPQPESLRGAVKYYFQRKNNHRFLYDEAALSGQLSAAGFSNIKRKTFGDSLIPEIRNVDMELRFKGALCLEAIKE